MRFQFRVRIAQKCITAIIVFALAGCMTPPEFPNRVSVEQVVVNARCELYDAVHQNIGRYPWLAQMAVAFDFSFVVERDASASTDTAYLVPINFGSFTIDLKADLKTTAKGTYALNVKILKGLGNFEASGCGGRPDNTHERLLAGEIGLRRWLNQVVDEIDRAKIANAVPDEPKFRESERSVLGELGSLSYTIEFGVTADGSLLPSWSLLYPSKKKFTPGFNLTGTDANTHKLIVALTPIPTHTDPIDSTGVISTVGGKKVILARRVCTTAAPNLGACVGEEEKAAATKAKAAAQEKISSSLEKINTLTAQLPNDVRQSIQGFNANSDSTAPTVPLTSEQLKTVKGLAVNKAELAAASQTLTEANKILAAPKASAVQIQAATAAAQRATNGEIEAETARRLDQLIQQQIIRDAFMRQ